MMQERLLEQFVAEELNGYVRGLIQEAVEARAVSPEAKVRNFEFNRFNLTMDFENQIAVIEDILDPSDAGALRVSLSNFLARVL